MALPSRYGVDKKFNSMEGLSAYENGGKGSGNFGHAGRPGEVGGSGDGKGNPDILKIVDVLKKDKSYDLHGMSPETVVELIGEDTIHKDNLEDLQELIDGASDEMSALEAEAEAEFGPMKKGSKVSQIGGKEAEEIAHAVAESMKLEQQLWAKKRELESANDELDRIADEQTQIERDRSRGIDSGDTSHLDSLEQEYTESARKLRREISDLKRQIEAQDKILDDYLKKDSEKNSLALNGGKGSGNFGHAGRPGEVGGSGKGGASQTVSDGKGGDGSKYGKYSRAKTYTHTGVMRHTADGRIVTDSDYEPEVYRDIAKAQGVAQTIGEESYTGAFDGIDGTAKDVGRAQATLALDLERVGEELLDAGNTNGKSLEQHLKNLDTIVKIAEDHFAEYEYGIAHGQSHDIENLAGGTPKQVKAILARDRALREAYRTMKRCAEKAHQLKPNYTDEAYYKDIDITDVWKD